MENTTDYQKRATQIRQHVLKMAHRAKSGHVGTNFSAADLLAVLYSGILNVRPDMPDWKLRDRFILSKGHGCASVYAALALRGFFPLDWLETFYQNGGKLAGHITHKGVPGVEASTGSLGHGLSIGCGMALAAKRSKEAWRTFVMLSDGELDEGSNWESILFAPHHQLDNLIAIVDYNKLQSLTWVKDTLNLEPLQEKWVAFGWSVKTIDGHDVSAIEAALKSVPFEPGKPSCIIANTIKGKGVSFMENNNLWHYRTPDEAELKHALEELNINM